MKNLNLFFKRENSSVMYVLFSVFIYFTYISKYNLAKALDITNYNNETIFLALHSTTPIYFNLYDLRIYIYVYLPFFMMSTIFKDIGDLYILKTTRKKLFIINYMHLIKKCFTLILVIFLIDFGLTTFFLGTSVWGGYLLPFILQIIILFVYLFINIIFREIITIKYKVNNLTSVFVALIGNMIFFSVA